MNLNKDFFETKWGQFRRKALNRRNKRRSDQLIKIKGVRERSIRILQKRHGYTREQATYQLDTHYPTAWLG